jgi:ATP-dependent phosphoenolpyruvate carboxykinase
MMYLQNRTLYVSDVCGGADKSTTNRLVLAA